MLSKYRSTERNKGDNKEIPTAEDWLEVCLELQGRVLVNNVNDDNKNTTIGAIEYKGAGAGIGHGIGLQCPEEGEEATYTVRTNVRHLG